MTDRSPYEETNRIVRHDTTSGRYDLIILFLIIIVLFIFNYLYSCEFAVTSFFDRYRLALLLHLRRQRQVIKFNELDHTKTGRMEIE